MDASEVRSALRIAARILDDGEAKHPPGAPNYWLQVSLKEHLRRAITHLDRVLVGATSGDDDLGHALARLMLAVELRERGYAEGTR
jgi:hypothetical protein